MSELITNPATTVNLQVNVVDDQPVDCSKVNASYLLGHDHPPLVGHPLQVWTA